jgi:hypothetical protein
MSEVKQEPWAIDPLNACRIVLVGRGAMVEQVPVAECVNPETAALIVQTVKVSAGLLAALRAFHEAMRHTETSEQPLWEAWDKAKDALEAANGQQ